MSPSAASHASIDSIRSESFREAVHNIESGSSLTESLVQYAKSLIKTLAASDKDIFQYGESKLSLHPVLREMLAHANICGGIQGTRSTACRIAACVRNEDPRSEATIDMLRDLATTWVSHFLFVFKRNKPHSTQSIKYSSEAAIPSLTDTAMHLDDGLTSTNRRGSFRDDLLERDGYQCIVTGFYDDNCPPVNRLGEEVPGPWVTLEGCHILRRAVAVFNSRKTDEYMSALTTWDILCNYAQLPPTILDDLSFIDDPSNGFLLEKNAHDGFATFRWCLVKTEVEHRYKVKAYDKKSHIFTLESNQDLIVEFKNRSEEYPADVGSSRKRPREIPLPDPHLISIHAAITGVMHMSGAGKFLDELLKKYDPDTGGSSAVLAWEDLERAVELADMREGLGKALKVH